MAGLFNILGNVVEEIQDFVSDLPVDEIMNSIGNGLDSAGEALKNAGDWVGGAAGEVGEGLGKAAEGVGNFMENTVGGISEAINKVDWNGIADTLNQLPKFLEEARVWMASVIGLLIKNTALLTAILVVLCVAVALLIAVLIFSIKSNNKLNKLYYDQHPEEDRRALKKANKQKIDALNQPKISGEAYKVSEQDKIEK